MPPQTSAIHALGTGTEFSWTTGDQQEFLARSWVPAGNVRGVVLAIHGLSGASQDFSPLGKQLADLGWAVHAPELRGQGRDPVVARRGDLSSLTDWYQDLEVFRQILQQRHPGVPWILVGESMGAAIAVRWLQYSQGVFGAGSWINPCGLVLFSPVLDIDHPVTFWQEILFRGLSRILPTKRVKLGDFAPQEEQELRVTRDESYQEYIYTAPHHLDSYSLRFVRLLAELIQGCMAVPLPAELPLLIPYARWDVFIKPQVIERYFEGLPTRDKTKLLYSESYHCLLHDLDVEVVLRDVANWMERVLKDASLETH